MSGAIAEIGEKRDDDKWAQVKQFREKLAGQSEKGGEAAGAGAAAQASQAGGAAAAGAVEASQAVQSKSDVAGISSEALTETSKTNTGNSAEQSRVNFGAWGLGGDEGGAAAVGGGSESGKAEGVSGSESVSKSKQTSTEKNPKRAAGEAGASEAAAANGAAGAASSVQTGGPQVNEASGAATAKKPQTVPGLGEAHGTKKTVPGG